MTQNPQKQKKDTPNEVRYRVRPHRSKPGMYEVYDTHNPLKEGFYHPSEEECKRQAKIANDAIG